MDLGADKAIQSAGRAKRQAASKEAFESYHEFCEPRCPPVNDKIQDLVVMAPGPALSAKLCLRT